MGKEEIFTHKVMFLCSGTLRKTYVKFGNLFAAKKQPPGRWIVFSPNACRKKLPFVEVFQKKEADILCGNKQSQTKKMTNYMEIWHHNEIRYAKVYESSNLQLQDHSSTFILKNESFLSATSVLSQRPKPMPYSTTASTDELTRTDYLHFGKCQDGLCRFSWSKND